MVPIRLHKITVRVGMVLQELYSEGARWLYVFVAGFIITPCVKIWKNLKQEREAYKRRLDCLEGKVDKMSEKLDLEVEERKSIGARFDKIEDKLDRNNEKANDKFDIILHKLTEVTIDTAVNSNKIHNK